MTGEPIPPEDVRLFYADGTEVPISCIYDGFRDGMHLWEMIVPRPELPVRVTIAELPPHTRITARGVGP
jgi:hypothetical protein